MSEVQKLSVRIPHVWDIDDEAVGVAHELVLDGRMLTARDISTHADGSERSADEVTMPLVDAVHILRNMTPAEREFFGTQRTTVPVVDESASSA